MSRPHDPYVDPAVRRRHRRLAWRAFWRVAKWVLIVGVGLSVLLSIIVAGIAYGSSGEWSTFWMALWFSLFGTLFYGSFVVAPVFAILRVVAGGRIRRTGKAFGPHYCKQCGYSLAGLTEPQCPECGRALALRSRSGANFE